MKIQANNQHDNYAQAANILFVVIQFKDGFFKLNDAITNATVALIEAMQKELDQEKNYE